MFLLHKRNYTIILILWAISGLITAQEIDKSIYITVDEIKPGMDAYCLTTYKGTEIERFELEVLDVVRNYRPGRDAIMVIGTDERFIHTGPVAGCSGSPVFIDGRLAGALAFGWTYSKDPLYGVTPIEDMLKVGKTNPDQTQQQGYMIDFSEPLDLHKIYQRAINPVAISPDFPAGTNALLCPLITTGLSEKLCNDLDAMVRPLGLMAVAGGSTTNTQNTENVTLQRGATLAVPLCMGDITMTAIGTVTEVKGDQVYGFGHSFLGYGKVDFPMATGKIHTVVSNLVRSFKFGSGLDVVGAITVDESSAIYGKIGQKAKLIPLNITVQRYNDTQKRTYNCQLVNNRIYTAPIGASAISGATLMLGSLPLDHSIEYQVSIGFSQGGTIKFKNFSTGVGLKDMLTETIGTISALTNNPYKKVDIESIDVAVNISQRNAIAHIWSAQLSDTIVKSGDTIKVDVVIESVLEGKKEYSYDLKIPQHLKPGKYELMIAGSANYKRFLTASAPYKFKVENFNTLISALNQTLAVAKSKLYIVLSLGTGGITIETDILPDLPATRIMVMQDAKRTVQIKPYKQWIEKQFQTNSVIIDKKTFSIIVEK